MRVFNIRFSSLMVCLIFLSGCATNLTKASRYPEPSKVKFSEFEKIEMKSVQLNPEYAEHGANQKAKNKIDELIFAQMHYIFPDIERIDEGEEFSESTQRTLRITPVIKEIKFIGGGARFWVGAMAGSSAVLMQATFEDGATGETIADPEFYRDGGAYAGAYSFGRTDNKMLEEVVDDIVKYTSYNK